MIHRRLSACCLLVALLWLPALAHASDVQATLDRTSVRLGETVTLNLRIANAGSNMVMPDLSALSQDFDVLGSSQNNSLSIVNGGASSELIFGVVLRPRHAGVLTIPALTLGSTRSAPLQLQVGAADSVAAAAAHSDVLVESQVEPSHGYVGQQFSYVVRLLYATDLSGGSLDQPQVDGVEISAIGNDVTYTTQRDGRTYNVRERRYSLTPQHAGRIVISPAAFQGQAVDSNDPNSFFGAGTPVSASASPLTLDVRAVPPDWGSSAWLPARQLSLSLDGWPGATEPVRVGQPLNLTMNLQTTGLGYDTLPALSLPAVDGATVYPDKPAMGNHGDGPWIVGRRQQSFAVVPERAGTLTIPATTLKWWNVQTDRMAMAQIPARSVTVLPAIGAARQPPGPAGASSAAIAPITKSIAAPAPATSWRWIAIGSLGLWLLSMSAWLLWRRRRPGSAPVVSPRGGATRQLQQAFLNAARDGDPAAQTRSLLAWAHAERAAIQNLGQLSEALGDQRQRAAIDTLQRRRYAAATIPEDRSLLIDAFKRGFAWHMTETGDDNPELPPLYPFKLH
ncbi:MAG: BatD family protein [Rhodanobacter sp.]